MITAQRSLRQISVLVLVVALLIFTNIFAQAGEGKVVGYYSQDGKFISDETAEEAFNKAEKYYSQNAFDEAIAEYTKAIELDPNNPNAYLERMIFYQLLTGKEDAAKKYSDKYLQLLREKEGQNNISK